MPLTAEDIIEAVTEPCPNSVDKWTENKVIDATCFQYSRCGKCDDGKILSREGERLAELLATKKRGEI